jgi:hypothetical protein
VGVQSPDALLDLERSRERRLHRHLLIEGEADQQRHRLLCEKRIRFVVTGEVEHRGDGHAEMLLRVQRDANSVRERLIDELDRVVEQLVSPRQHRQRLDGLQRLPDHDELVEGELELMHLFRRYERDPGLEVRTTPLLSFGLVA